MFNIDELGIDCVAERINKGFEKRYTPNRKEFDEIMKVLKAPITGYTTGLTPIRDFTGCKPEYVRMKYKLIDE